MDKSAINSIVAAILTTALAAQGESGTNTSKGLIRHYRTILKGLGKDDAGQDNG